MKNFFENELAQKFEEMIENNQQLYFDTDDLEEIIIHYLEIGDISFAEKATNYGLVLHPSSIVLKIKQLEVFVELKANKQAKELIDELEDISMENTDFLVCTAKYYSNQKKHKKSLFYCKKALELGEEVNFLHNFIADEYVNLGDPFKALVHYKAALEADYTDYYALENCVLCYTDLKKLDEAKDFVANYLDQYPFSEIAWYEYGQVLCLQKNFEEAIKAFDYVLAINDGNVSVYSHKAACHEALDQYDKAVDVYRELLEIEFTKAHTYYRIGLCLKKLKQTTNALVAFQKALVEDPQYFLALMEQSYLYEELGAMKEALHFAKEAVFHSEANPEYQKRLAFLYIDGGEMEEGLACLEKLLTIEPNHFYNWYAYIEVLMLLQRYDDALLKIEKALVLHPRAELYYQLSNCYFQLDEEEKGLAALEIAVSLDATMVIEMKEKYPSISQKMKPKADNKK